MLNFIAGQFQVEDFLSIMFFAIPIVAIGGVITLFSGVGIGLFLHFITGSVHGDGDAVWAVGIIPTFVGVALLLSSWLVWPRGGNGTSA